MPDLILDPPINGVSKVVVRDSNPLGRGGEAIIYPAELAGKVYAAKIFHNPVNVNIQKIMAMIMNPPVMMESKVAGLSFPMYSWPLGILFENNTAVGFLMPLIDLKQSYTLDYYYDRGLIGSLNSVNEYALSYRVEIAMHLSEMVADLHQHQHYFIDIKPQNIRVFKTTHAVTLIDCDGFSIFEPATNARFPANMYSSDYIAPEVLKANLPANQLGEEQDLYGLATIIFQLFNWGIHPFQGIVKPGLGDLDTNDDKAKALLYPHGIIPHPQINARPQSVHSCFDDVTRQMFDQAFIGPANARPKASQWADHLRNLYESKQLAKCPTYPNDIKHMRWAGKDCPQCLIDKASQSDLQPKLQAISIPKPVSGSSFSPVNSSSTPKKKNNNWIYGVVTFVVLLIIKVAVNSNSSSTSVLPPIQAAPPPVTYYTSMWVNPETGYFAINAGTDWASVDASVRQACGYGCVKQKNVPDAQCIAASSGPKGWSFNTGTNKADLERSVYESCSSKFGNCSAAVSVCAN